MAKIKKSPLVDIYGKRYLLDIDMDNLPPELLEKIASTMTPKSSSISSSLRGISLIDTPDHTLEYIAFSCVQCKEDLQMMAQIEYMIRSYQNELYTKKEIEAQFKEWYPSVYKTNSIDF